MCALTLKKIKAFFISVLYHLIYFQNICSQYSVLEHQIQLSLSFYIYIYNIPSGINSTVIELPAPQW
jgi:hypothetical protein